MREIKFRAWYKKESRMFDLYRITPFFLNESIDGLFIPFGEDYELMQYTGLKDKNGKEIYEGDVVQFSNKREWYRNLMFAAQLDGKTEKEKQKLLDEQPYERREVKIPSCYEEFSDSDLEYYWEVIGNIYENPELIK